MNSPEPTEFYFWKAYSKKDSMESPEFSADMCKMLRARRNGYQKVGETWLIKGPIDDECEAMFASYSEAKRSIMHFTLEECQDKLKSGAELLDANCLASLEQIHYRQYRFTKSGEHLEEVGMVDLKPRVPLDAIRPIIKPLMSVSPFGAGTVSAVSIADAIVFNPGFASVLRDGYNATASGFAKVGSYFGRTVDESSEK